jgi:hypothetical protein
MLADAAEVQGHRAEDANCWQLLGAKLLSVLLFAAAGTGRSMADVARWVDVQDVDDVATALMEIGNQQALDAWAACTSRPDNTMGSVYGTAETLLDVYGDPVIAASAEVERTGQRGNGERSSGRERQPSAAISTTNRPSDSFSLRCPRLRPGAPALRGPSLLWLIWRPTAVVAGLVVAAVGSHPIVGTGSSAPTR